MLSSFVLPVRHTLIPSEKARISDVDSFRDENDFLQSRRDVSLRLEARDSAKGYIAATVRVTCCGHGEVTAVVSSKLEHTVLLRVN